MTTSTLTRFVALDVHRKFLVVGAVDTGQKVVLSGRSFGFEAFDEWVPTHLTLCRCRVCLKIGEQFYRDKEQQYRKLYLEVNASKPE